MWHINEREAQKLLKDMIAIDSVNPGLVPGGAGEEAMANYILDYLTSLEIPARLDHITPGRPNVVGLLASSKTPEGSGINRSTGYDGEFDFFDGRHGLILNGHLDTVGTEGMEIEPLVATIDGNRVYGRGSFDMKGGLVMGLLALAAVKRAKVGLEKSVLLTGVVDEEYSSIGTEDVVRRYRADAAVVMEPTGLELCLAHKGFAWLTVETYGRAAHGSDYRRGIDAITKMGRFLSALETLDQEYSKGKGHPLLGRRSIHSSLIEGGRELSTYPDYCKARFERRTLPGEDPAAITAEVKALCDDLSMGDPEFDARIALDFLRRGYEIEEDHPVAKAFAASISAVTGKEPKVIGMAGWLESALLGEAGIPSVIFGPAGDGAHAAAEYVLLDTVIAGAEILADAIVRLCGDGCR